MTTKFLLESETCGRCGGSGNYSFCQTHGTRCFGCAGHGAVLTKRGRIAQDWLRTQRLVRADSFVVGDKYFSEGFDAGSYKEPNRWIKVESIEINNGVIYFTGVASKSLEKWNSTALPGDLLRKAQTDEQRNALHAAALAYQATLSKTGKVSTPEQLAQYEKAAATRAATKAAKKVAAQAAAVIAAQEALAAFRASNGDFLAKLAVLDGQFWEGFKESFHKRSAAPTERQVALVDAEIAKRVLEASKPPLAYVGVVGEKQTLTLTCERILTFPGAYGTVIIYLCRDEAGNRVIYKGSAAFLDEGETATVTATIKQHDDYRGERQTAIQRPKITEKVA